MSRALLVQVRQMWRSTLFDLSRDKNIRLIHSSDREVVLGVSRWNSFSTERGLESTKVCLDLLRKRTNLDDRELYKIVSSVETIGFNAVGQMYRKNTPEALDYRITKDILDYFEGLESVDLRRVLRNSPFILGASRLLLDSFEPNRRRVMDSLELQDKQMGKIISSNAYVVSRPFASAVGPCLDYLESLGYTTSEIRSIVLRFPRILMLSRGKIEGVKESLRIFGIGEEDFVKILWKFPPVAGLSASKIEVARRWLEEQGLDGEDALKASVSKFPQILSHNLEEKVDPMVKYMVQELGLPKLVVRTALLAAPDVFGRSLDTIKKNVAALESIGMTKIDITRYLTSFPGGLRIDIRQDPYLSKLGFLENNLGQKPSAVLPIHPRYLSYSMDRIAPRAEFLRSKQRSTNGVTGWCAASDVVFAQKFARATIDDWLVFKSNWAASA